MKSYIKETLLSIPHVAHYMNRYIKLLESPVKLGRKTEYHHIIPRSIMPDYTDNQDNIVAIPTRLHFIVHWCLSHAFKGQNSYKMRRAFFLMCQSSKNHNRSRSSIAYEYSKKLLVGIKASDETRAKMSERIKGTLPVRYPDGTTKRISVNHVDYTTGLCVPTSTGAKKSEEVRKKIGKGLRGKVRVIRAGVVMYTDHILPDDIINNKSTSDMAKNRFTDLLHFYNPATGEKIRCKENEAPENFIRGRPMNNPFRGCKILKNFLNQEIIKTTINLEWGGPLSVKFVIVNHIDKLVFSNRKSFSKYYGISNNAGTVFSVDQVANKLIPNQTPQNKTYKELGFELCAVENLNDLKSKGYVWIRSEV